mmetsp:Transcript_61854/g.172757  ORF Transcript_61854/g.172757 Transcript_61854/m.172757 type:complete len:259 (-) Transcript_61854:651-1427(-)
MSTAPFGIPDDAHADRGGRAKEEASANHKPNVCRVAAEFKFEDQGRRRLQRGDHERAFHTKYEGQRPDFFSQTDDSLHSGTDGRHTGSSPLGLELRACIRLALESNKFFDARGHDETKHQGKHCPQQAHGQHRPSRPLANAARSHEVLQQGGKQRPPADPKGYEAHPVDVEHHVIPRRRDLLDHDPGGGPCTPHEAHSQTRAHDHDHACVVSKVPALGRVRADSEGQRQRRAATYATYAETSHGALVPWVHQVARGEQ